MVAADALHEELEPAVLLLPAGLVELILVVVEDGSGAFIGKIDALFQRPENVAASEAARAHVVGGGLSDKHFNVQWDTAGSGSLPDRQGVLI